MADDPGMPDRVWDVIVVGAGPAGSTAARLLAERGARTLLVDRARFPRDKVCGCCVNERAATVLRDVGAGGALESLRANAIRTLRVRTRAGSASFPLPPTRCVSRAAFDARLLDEAQDAGVRVLTGTTARIGACTEEARHVHIDEIAHVARLVICAAGLRASSALPEDFPPSRPWRHARVGLATTVDHAPGLAHDELRMVCAPGGYVGMATLEDGRIDIAAAVDPALVRDAGGPARAIEALLRRAGFESSDWLTGARWHGAPPLTHRRNPAAERLLLIGDAARYVEPFTGEGIAWALQTGCAVVPLALDGARDWRGDIATRWRAEHARIVGVSARRCRAIATLVRRPAIVSALIRARNSRVRLSMPIVRALAGDLLAVQP